MTRAQNIARTLRQLSALTRDPYFSDKAQSVEKIDLDHKAGKVVRLDRWRN